MATKRRRKAVARRNPAGRTRRRTTARRRTRRAVRMNPTRRRTVRRTHRRRSNPGPIGNPKTWIVGGAGVLAGVFVSRGLPQMILGAGNTGPMGYAANAAAAAAAGYATHMLTKNSTLTAGVVAGGFAALLARLISDYTPYGKALALSGWGDYQFSNIVGTVPQRLLNMNSAQTEWGAPGNGVSASRGGGDARGGNC